MLLAIPAVMVIALSSCDDDSSTPETPDDGSQVGGGGTDVDDLTDDDGTGTVLPSDTSPGATEPPNPNAGQGGGTPTNAP